MTHAVFLSMGGEKDTQLAEEVMRHLPTAMVYMYTKTGADHVSFREEIESEIGSCVVFVAFWSHDYLNSPHAKIELALMHKSLQERRFTREIIVVQVERKGPNIHHEWINPINHKKEPMLGDWRYARAGEPGADSVRIAELIKRRLAVAERMPRTLIPRPEISAAIKRAISVPGPGWQIRHFCFLTGLEGNGRRTALEQFMETAYAGITPRRVPFDNIDGPEDLLIGILNVSGATQDERQAILRKIGTEKFDIFKEIRTLLYKGVEARAYYVLVMDKFTAIDAVDIPNWLAQAFGNIQSGNDPLIFLVTSNPIPDAVKAHFPKAGKIRVDGLDDREMEELVYRLASRDKHPGRWTDEALAMAKKAAGGSPGLCQIIMYTMRFEPNLDHLKEIVGREEQTFANAMSALLGKIIDKFSQNRTELLALRVIDHFKLASSRALNEILEPLIGNEKFDLYHLLEYGLIERMTDDLYRIPPLIQRRLGDGLWQKNIDFELEPLLKQFSEKVKISEDDYGVVYAVNKGKAALLSDAHLPDEFTAYLTTASIFKEGLIQYTAGNYELAHSILGRAFDRLSKKNNLDQSTKIEIARYYGLASARIESDSEVINACVYLEQINTDATPNPQAEAMSYFLKGFLERVKGHNRDAVANFKAARNLLKGVRGAGRQLGAVLTELSRAYLRQGANSADDAVEAAEAAYVAKEVPHNISGLIRAKLARAQTYRDDAKFDVEIAQAKDLLAPLKEIDKRTGGEFHMAGWADLERLIAFRASSRNGLPANLTKAIDWQEKAVATKPRQQNIANLWLLKIFRNQTADLAAISASAESILADSENQRRRAVLDAAKFKFLILLRENSSEKKNFLDIWKKYFSENGQRQLIFLARGNSKPKWNESFYKEMLNLI